MEKIARKPLFLLTLFLLVISRFSSLTAHQSAASHGSTTAILQYAGMDPEYLLSVDHWLMPVLDHFFASPQLLNDQKSLDQAGFVTLYTQPSGMRVLRHVLLPGYLIKCYLNAEKRRGGQDFSWLIGRCEGARNIRNLIKEKHLKYFTVPDKWIYILPGQPFADPDMQTAVLVVQDMNLVDRERSKEAWKTKITHRHLKELYCILSHGFASCYLPYNIPYTKDGTFSCIDTIYPKRVHDYRRVRPYLSDEMKIYWDKLVKERAK